MALKRLLGRVLVMAVFAAVLSLPASATTFEYDSLHRLTRVTYDNGTVIEYTYDAVGNRTLKRITP